MKQHVLIVATLLLLTGCNKQPEDASQASSAPAPSATAIPSPSKSAPAVDTSSPDPGKSCVGQSGCDALPPNVAIEVPHELRSGRIYVGAAGTERRQLAFEIMEVDAADTLEAFKQSMLDAGFTSGGLQRRENGVQGIRFEKDGYGVVRAWVNPSVGAKPVNPEAKCILGVDMPNSV